MAPAARASDLADSTLLVVVIPSRAPNLACVDEAYRNMLPGSGSEKSSPCRKKFPHLGKERVCSYSTYSYK